MTNAKVHQGFHDDKKAGDHCPIFIMSYNIQEKTSTEELETIRLIEVGKVIAIYGWLLSSQNDEK